MQNRIFLRLWPQMTLLLTLVLPTQAKAYCWTHTASGIVHDLQDDVERNPEAALRKADHELARLQGGIKDPQLGAWLYAIEAAAQHQLNGSATVKDAANKGLHLIRGIPSGARMDLQLALLNSMSTAEEMQRAIGRYDAAERSSDSAAARICIMIQRGGTLGDLNQIQMALADLTNAYVESRSLPDDYAALRAHSATALASVLSRRLLIEIASPLFAEAFAEYKRLGFDFDIITMSIREGLAKSFDGQSRQAITTFETLLRSPHVDMLSDDILAIVQAHLCGSYAKENMLGRADQACSEAERLSHGVQNSTTYTVYRSRADLALRRHRPRQALAFLAKAAPWRFAEPPISELDARARAYTELGATDKAAPLWIEYAERSRKMEREDRAFFADAWRARVFALEKETERLQLSRNLALSRERAEAQRKQMRITAAASAMIIFLLLAISIISWRARSRTLRLTREIQQQARDKIRMIAHISHEIRSPLGSMTLLARALRTSGETPEDAKLLLSRMDANGERISRLLTDMLDYSRLEAGQLSLKPADIALRPLLNEVLETRRADLDHKDLVGNITIEKEVPSTFWCDGQRLFQVLDNLVANAVRFTDQGGITLRAAISPDREALVLTVEDTGIGIPPDQLDRLFSDFQQVETEAHERGGVGLGLVISRTLVTAMGGILTLAAGRNGGVIASVTIPLDAMMAMPVHHPQSGVWRNSGDDAAGPRRLAA